MNGVIEGIQGTEFRACTNSTTEPPPQARNSVSKVLKLLLLMIIAKGSYLHQVSPWGRSQHKRSQLETSQRQQPLTAPEGTFSARILD